MHDGKGIEFNFIMSNGSRSLHRDQIAPTTFTFFMPEAAVLRSVNIYYNDRCVQGFQFFNQDGEVIFKIGWATASNLKVEVVMLEENDLIIGVVAKLRKGYQSAYSDFQF